MASCMVFRVFLSHQFFGEGIMFEIVDGSVFRLIHERLLNIFINIHYYVVYLNF